YLGFRSEDSTVTVHSNVGSFTQVWLVGPGVHDTLLSLSDALVTGSGNFNRGVYVLLMAPSTVQRFTQEGWTLADVRHWLLTNCGRSLAELKRRGFPPAGRAHELWNTEERSNTGDSFQDDIITGRITEEDEQHFVRLFASNGDIDKSIWSQSQLTRETDIYIVPAGGEVSYGCIIMPEYDVSTVPVTVKIDSIPS